MAHAEICPVCGGRGTTADSQAPTTAGVLEKTCHGCNGSGWVTVGTDYPPVCHDTWPYTGPSIRTLLE